MHWNYQDPEASNIWIVDSYAHDIEQKTEKKPLIVFSRGPVYTSQGYMYENLARLENRVLDKSKPKIAQQIQYRTFMVTGQCEWKCISRQGVEAESIASVVAMLHQAHLQVLLQKGLHSIKSISIGDESVIAGDVETEMVMVPVSINYDMQVHYEYWETNAPFNHGNIIGEAPGGDKLLNTDP